MLRKIGSHIIGPFVGIFTGIVTAFDDAIKMPGRQLWTDHLFTFLVALIIAAISFAFCIMPRMLQGIYTGLTKGILGAVNLFKKEFSGQGAAYHYTSCSQKCDDLIATMQKNPILTDKEIKDFENLIEIKHKPALALKKEFERYKRKLCQLDGIQYPVLLSLSHGNSLQEALMLKASINKAKADKTPLDFESSDITSEYSVFYTFLKRVRKILAQYKLFDSNGKVFKSSTAKAAKVWETGTAASAPLLTEIETDEPGNTFGQPAYATCDKSPRPR